MWVGPRHFMHSTMQFTLVKKCMTNSRESVLSLVWTLFSLARLFGDTMFGYNIAHKTMTPTMVQIVPKKHLSTLHQIYFRHIQEYPSHFKVYNGRRQIWRYGVTLKPMLTSICATNIVWSIHEDKSKTSGIRPTPTLPWNIWRCSKPSWLCNHSI